MTVKIEKLEITEILWVDKPANELDGWMVIKKASAASFKDDQELLDFVLAGLEANLAKANPGQHRGADGKYRPHIADVTDRQPSAGAAGTSPDEPVARSFFRPARDVYRRIF